MVVIAPLVDMLAQGSSMNTMEDAQISRLLSERPILRNSAAEWLRKNGDSVTATKLEDILIKNGLSKEVKKEVAKVLTDLSFRNMDFGRSTKDRLSRMSALASALRLRS